jgi:site-specific recombinase XerD
MRPTGEIYAAALTELRRLAEGPLCRRLDRVAFRDSLMLAMLTARPIRLRNFSDLRIGDHLLREGRGWLIVIPGAQVKNRQPIEHTLPDSIIPFLELYLERVRPSFIGKATDQDALWRGFEGGRLSPEAIYGRIRGTSERLLGVAINPHLLRDCAATSLSTVSPAAALSAAALLGHRQFATTERYYIRANQLEAGRTINAMLATIRSSTG